MSRAAEQEQAEQRRIAEAKRTAGAGEDRRSRGGQEQQKRKGEADLDVREGSSAVINNNPTVGGSETRRLRNLRSDDENEKKQSILQAARSGLWPLSIGGSFNLWKKFPEHNASCFHYLFKIFLAELNSTGTKISIKAILETVDLLAVDAPCNFREPRF